MEIKKKEKLIKVVLRRLPPDMTFADLEKFLGPNVDNFLSFVPSDPRFTPHNFSRCYFAFPNEDDVVEFANKFNRQLFVDSRGNESTAIVELAMFPKIPKNGRAQVGKDAKCGKIEDEIDYKKFLDELRARKEVSVLTLDEQMRYVREKEKAEQDSVLMDTPLTQFMIKKNEEKYKRIEDKRRERRRGKSDKQENSKLSTGRKEEKEDKEDVDRKREDWEKFKKKLVLAARKPKVKGSTIETRLLQKIDQKVLKLASKQVEYRARPNTAEKESRKADRIFARSAPRTERITAMTKEEKKVIKVRPEREIYRPGQHRKAAASSTSGNDAS